MDGPERLTCRHSHRVHPRSSKPSCFINELCTLKDGHPMSRFGPVTGKHDTRHAKRPRGETVILISWIAPIKIFEIMSAQPSKRRCVSTACVACRKRKSKVGLSYSGTSVSRSHITKNICVLVWWEPAQLCSLLLSISHTLYVHLFYKRAIP